MQLLQRQELGSRIVDADEDSARSDLLDLEAILATVKRQWRLFAVCVAVAALIGGGYILTAVPQYTASTRVLIDRSSSEVMQQLSSGVAMGGEDDGSILSQVEVLKSESIALAVVDKLNLTENPLFMGGSGSMISQAIGIVRSVVNVSKWFSSEAPDAVEKDEMRNAAAARLTKEVEVTRVGRSFVLEIGYTSPSATLAAQIANGIASEYLIDKLNAKYEATRRASDWLADRIAELRRQALETDQAVQRFRAEKGLIQTDKNGLVSDQQLTELNSALTVARSETAKARARVDRIEQILKSDEVDAVVADILESVVASDLRKKYLEASKLEAEISSRLGSQHVQAIRLRNEMREYKRLMFEEVNRTAQSYKSDYEVAAARERSLTESVDAASKNSVQFDQARVQLRELEREAETAKNIYQTFLQRYQETIQQQSFPVTDARVISSATPPQKPSKPMKPLVLALSMFLGGLVGFSLCAFREFRDRFFRTEDQVRKVLGLEFLGNIPEIASKPTPQLPADGQPDKSRSIVKTQSVSDFVVQFPMSSMAETLRATRLAVDVHVPNKPARLVGVVSSLPGEGKSTVATNFAELLASQGARTIVIDMDLRNPSLTRSLGRHARAGLLEVLLENRDYREVMLANPKTGLHFIPTVLKQRIPHSSELLISAAMRKLLSELSAHYDYVICDLPPLGPVVDARAMAERLDAFVYVVEWGATARRMVRTTLDNERSIRDKCVGVILNKVDVQKLKLYLSYGSGEYYQSTYTNYYKNEA